MRLEKAIDYAKRAGDSTLPHFRSSDLKVDTKSDLSPVTIADRNAETILRDLIEADFPDDAILGEEFGSKAGTNEYQWILDPIDGTFSFVHGVPFYGTLIGILKNGVPIIGVLYLPALEVMVYASDGFTYVVERNGDPVKGKVNRTTSLSEAVVCTSSRDYFRMADQTDAWNKIADTALATRTWGDCYGYYLLVTGRIDMMIDCSVFPWDCAALLPIVEGAGGHFVDWNNEAKIDTGNCIAGARALVESSLNLIS